MSKEFFLFKFNFVDKVNRKCAYIKTILEFLELEKSIIYWLFEERELPICGIELYWFDIDGDQFKVRNSEDYDIFKSKNPQNGVLWASVNEKNEQQEILQFKHTCKTCESCHLTNNYKYSKVGFMRCAVCNSDRGHCCLYIVEGENIPHVMIGQKQYISEKEYISADNNNNHAVFPTKENNIDIACVSSKDEEEINAQLRARLENIFEKSTDDDNASTISTVSSLHSNATLNNKFTKTISKPRTINKVIKAPQELPVHVENALQLMINMGYKNENGRLTQLLLARNGRIKDVLELLKPQSKIVEDE